MAKPISLVDDSADRMLRTGVVRILQRNKGITALTDVECPTHRDIPKLLYLSRHRPRDLDLHDLRCVPDPDVLTKWIASEARAVSYGSKNVALSLRALHSQLDSRPNGGTVGLQAFQFERYPVVAVSRVPEQDALVLIARVGAADLGEHILIAVVREVSERNAVSFCRMPKPPAVVTSWKDFPALLRNILLGSRDS